MISPCRRLRSASARGIGRKHLNFLFTVSHSSSMDCRYSILCLCDLSSLTVNGSGSVFSAPDWTL